VRGRGVHGKGRTGDLLVTVSIAVPTSLDADARAAVEELAARIDEDPRPQVTAAVRAGGGV
jgi:molecular chaperone DnaJ